MFSENKNRQNLPPVHGGKTNKQSEMKGTLSGSKRMIQSEKGGGIRATGKGGSECPLSKQYRYQCLEGFHHMDKVNV